METSTGMPTVTIVVLVILGLGLGVGIFFGVRRYQYVKAIRARGWEFVGSPSDEIAFGLLVPPFGVGFSRGTDDQILGRTSTGVDFQVFEYAQANNQRVVCMPLGLPLPELVACSAGQVRMGVRLRNRSMLPGGGLLLHDNEEFAAAFMALAGGPLAAFGEKYQVNFAVDGDQLTQVGAPKDVEELAAYLEALAPVAAAVQSGAAQLTPFQQPPPQKRLGFYRQPSWYYLPSDNGLLATVAHTGGGMNHRTANVIHGEFLPQVFFVAFEHHWQTQRTETYTDSEGRLQTRTVTDNHVEVIHEVTLPFGMPDLTITNDSRLNRMFKGQSIDFELSEFNDRFDVFCSSPKFASDVLHPRQIEFLMKFGAVPFTISGNRVRSAGNHDPEAIEHELNQLAGFLARIPTFVWQDLRVQPLPLRLTESGDVEVLGQ